MSRENYLFSKLDAFALQDHQRNEAKKEIAGMDGDRLLNSNVDDLAAYFLEKYRIDVPELDESGAVADQKEASRDVSGDPTRMAYFSRDRGPVHAMGAEVTIEVPFSGDAELFKVRPSTYNSSPPMGVVHGASVVFKFWHDKPEPEQIKAEFNRWLNDVKQWLKWQTETFGNFNAELEKLARDVITARRDKLLRNQNLVAGLGIPLKRRPGTSDIYTAPEVKRKIAPQLPTASKGAFAPEPVLDEAEYQHILGVLEHMVHVMERSPKAFHDIDEETLRTHFLVQLNGQYEGQATGETFNYQGKTDILIRSGDRNIFVAECKFWGGPAKLGDTIDQLLGYLTWRDSKAAILLFNRNKDFSKVLSAILEAVVRHPNCKKLEEKRSASSFRYAFRHKDDAAKVLHLTVLAFDVPRQET